MPRAHGQDGLIANLADKSIPVDPGANFPSRVVVDKQALHLPDWATVELPEYERRVHESGGVNASLMLPLLRADECIGVLSLARARAAPSPPRRLRWPNRSATRR